MNQVISGEQAKQITGGRKPLTFPEYERAISSIQECFEIDAAKYFSDMASAAQAWAKINHDESVLRLGKRLKLHAAKQMGLIAQRERPQRYLHMSGKPGNPKQPGPQSLLLEHGLSEDDSRGAIKLAKLSPEEFKALENRRTVPALSAVRRIADAANSEWVRFSSTSGFFNTGGLLKWDPREVALLVPKGSKDLLCKKARVLAEWFDAFEQALAVGRGTA